MSYRRRRPEWAYERGLEAHQLGLAVTANPFRRAALREAWDAAWRAAALAEAVRIGLNVDATKE